MDLDRVKQFYRETWWLWTLYLVASIIAIWKVHLIFISAIPLVVIISVYFAIVRGPSVRETQIAEGEGEHEEDGEQGSRGDDSQDESQEPSPSE